MQALHQKVSSCSESLHHCCYILTSSLSQPHSCYTSFLWNATCSRGKLEQTTENTQKLFRALSGELTSMSYHAFSFFLGQQFMKRFLITKRKLQFLFHLSESNKSALDKRLLLTVVRLFWPVNGIQPDFGVYCKRSKRALVQPNSLIANLSLQKPARIQGILMENHLMRSTHFKVFQENSHWQSESCTCTSHPYLQSPGPICGPNLWSRIYLRKAINCEGAFPHSW